MTTVLRGVCPGYCETRRELIPKVSPSERTLRNEALNANRGPSPSVDLRDEFPQRDVLPSPNSGQTLLRVPSAFPTRSVPRSYPC